MAITSNNVQNVKFLRNGSVFAPSVDPVKTAREVAKTAMENQLTSGNLDDGVAILGRYQETNGTVKTLVGFAYVSGNTKTLTVFDVEGASADVEALKQEINAKLGDGISSNNTATAQLTALSGTSSASSADTSVWGAKAYAKDYTDSVISNLDVDAITAPAGAFINAVSEADGKISASTAYMPTVEAISETGKAITAVSQSNGTVAASAGNINSQYVEVSYSAITATNVKAALAEIADEIDAMDKSASAVDGQVVTTISEADGKVSETKANVKDLQLGGYLKSSSTGAIASTDTVNEALSKLENKAAAITVTPKDKSIVVETTGATTEVGVNIRSGEKVLKLDTDATSGGVYTALDLVKITNDLPAEIKERYQFKASDGSVIGANIDIPKDSHIVSITYITTGEHAQNLEYKYVDVSGNTQTTYVDMSSLIIEAEFASGVTVTNHVAHGVVDSASEKDESNVAFLTVGADGFKVSGIKDEIDRKINALDADKSGSTTHVGVRVEEVNGKISAVTVTEDDIASAQGLADEITARGNADTELSNRLGNGVTTANTATAQFTALSGNAQSTSADTSVAGAKKYADAILTNTIAGLDADVSGNSTHVTVGVAEESGKITAVTVNESNIANASDLTAEIAARKAVDGQSGATYAANASTNYISGATSLNDADVKLDAQVKANADEIAKNKVAAGNGISVGTPTATGTTVSVKLDTTTYQGANALVVDSNGLRISTIDCGEY